MRHNTLNVHYLKNTKITEIEKEHKIVANDIIGQDGYHNYGTDWWTNVNCPFARKYLNIDSLYPEKYFGPEAAHLSDDRASILYNYMQETYRTLFGKEFSSVLELGSGNGEITLQFRKNNLKYIAVEGTTEGFNKLMRLGVPTYAIIKKNLKFFEGLAKKFDLVMCTEVAEHIEPWFASKVVENCVKHSDAVWFSAAKGNAPPHYHHINEVPIDAWDNIFAHFGFNYYVELNGIWDRADRLYLNSESMKRIVETQ